ncbi:MAG: zinc ribbon domain-containing protein [Bacteroidetes bacterium]|nr:zinc ribbon domain-containing protein [Bacteroidota bacterium]MCY4223872.1 zinc ribbon domain-containing protein [Bacteroidota bacterium]
MPTYDYRRADGTIFEIVQSITEDPLTECPTTGQPVERMISGGTGFILKGSGFYQTDYVSKPDPKESKPTSGEDDSSNKDNATSADTKKSETPKEKPKD